MRKTKLAIGLALVFLLSSLGPALAASLDQQLQQNQNEQKKLNNQISKYKDEEQDLKDAIAQTENDMSSTKAQLEQTTKDLNAANMEVSSAEASLRDSEERLAERTTALQKRMKGMYEEGQVSYLELLFQSASLGDFVNRIEYLSKILANDQRLVKEIQAEKQAIEDRKKALVKKRDSVAQVKARQERQNQTLQRQQTAYETQIKKNQEMQDALWEELKDSQAQEQQIRDLIRQSQIKNSNSSRPNALLWPAPASRSISSKFGYRTHPILHYVRLHSGIDIPVSTGSQVLAAASGTVIFAGSMAGTGYTIIIDHGGGLQTLYAHLSSYLVHAGQQVEKGQGIARSGGAPGAPGAGTSTGPHLHFETRINGVPEDPLNYL